VEVAAELHDMIYEDLVDLYPDIIKVRDLRCDLGFVISVNHTLPTTSNHKQPQATNIHPSNHHPPHPTNIHPTASIQPRPSNHIHPTTPIHPTTSIQPHPPTQDVKISVVELMDHVLSTYDRRIGEYTAQQWKRKGIDLVLNSRVASVRDGYGAAAAAAAVRWARIALASCSLLLLLWTLFSRLNGLSLM